jgi:hypothetical protein
MDLPPNSDVKGGQYSGKTNVSTIEELLKHLKTDPLISGDNNINASKSAVYTSDFVPIALSAPAGILRDGDTLIVTYHGGSGEKAATSKAYPSNAYKQAAAKIPSNMIDGNDGTGYKYNTPTFDDEFFGEAPVHHKHSKQSVIPHESNSKHVKSPYRSTFDEEDIRGIRPINTGKKPNVKTRTSESISSLGLNSTDHIEAGGSRDAGIRKPNMMNDQEAYHDKRTTRISHHPHEDEVLSSSKNSGTRHHKNSSESAEKSPTSKTHGRSSTPPSPSKTRSYREY